MILTLADFVLFAVTASGVLVLFFALASRVGRARAESRARRRRVVCRLCQHVFENDSGTRVVPCPACGVANETRGV